MCTVGAVYDVTICYRGEREPSIVGVMNVEPCASDICMRRYPLSEIPRDSDEAMSKWLIDLFKNKVGCSVFLSIRQCSSMSALLTVEPLNKGHTEVVSIDPCKKRTL